MRTKRPSDVDRPPDDALRELYVVQRLSVDAIGKQLGWSGTTVQTWLTDAGIHRTAGARRGRPRDARRPSDDELRRLYLDERLSTFAIGDRLGFANSTVSQWLRNANIPTRYLDYRGDGGSRGTVEQVCPTCGKHFWTWPSVIALGRKMYCCNACANSARGSGARGVKWTPERLAKQANTRKRNRNAGFAPQSEPTKEPETERLCRRCHDAKAIADFPPSPRPNGKTLVCTACRTMRHRTWNRGKRYGITIAAYDAMLAAQDNGCAICNRPCENRNLDVDHDHTTGAVRGLLCIDCNHALGRFHDSPELLRKAAAYLEHQTLM